MISAATKQTALPWIAAGFCAALAIITICGNLWISFVNQVPDRLGVTMIFVCFMPMCFVLMGFGVAKLQREIVNLQRQIAELQREKSSG